MNNLEQKFINKVISYYEGNEKIEYHLINDDFEFFEKVINYLVTEKKAIIYHVDDEVLSSYTLIQMAIDNKPFNFEYDHDIHRAFFYSVLKENNSLIHDLATSIAYDSHSINYFKTYQ